jgi:hypothetical protein
VSYVILYHDLLVLISPTPPFILQGVGLQGRSESVIIIPDWDTISTCLFYKIYLLYYVGYGLYYLDLLVEWADSWWAPLSCSPSSVGRVPMVPNVVSSTRVLGK